MPDPELERAVRRARPRKLQRVLLACLAAALAALCGTPAYIIGWVGTRSCDSMGSCLSYGLGGFFGAILLALIAWPLLVWRFGLGLWCGLLAIVLVAAPLWLGVWSAYGATALLGPGLAAWVSEPIKEDLPDPLAPPLVPPSSLRHWGPRIGAVLVLSVLIPVLGRLV